MKLCFLSFMFKMICFVPLSPKLTSCRSGCENSKAESRNSMFLFRILRSVNSFLCAVWCCFLVACQGNLLNFKYLSSLSSLCLFSAATEAINRSNILIKFGGLAKNSFVISAFGLQLRSIKLISPEHEVFIWVSE